MKKNILVFPCGSEIGLEIHRSLCFSTHFHLIGGSSAEDHGHMVYEDYVGDLPRVNAPNFLSRLQHLVAKRAIDFIFPAHDSVVLTLAQAAADGGVPCRVVTSPLATCEVARSKRKTYERLAGIVATPRMYELATLSPADLPVFMKPDVGQGSKGVYLARSLDEAAFYKQRDPSLLLLEYLPGAEFTVDCFTNLRGELLLFEARVRERISNGISVRSTNVECERFENLARKINDTLAFRGAWFFQVKENVTGDLALMEIAPRIAGTMGLTRCRGVNLPLLSLFDAMGQHVDVPKTSYTMSIDRALENRYRHDLKYKHVYLDFDDMVICNERVNPRVMAFVYQCINKGVQVHLLTKHRDELADTLTRHRLSHVFDDLIWLDPSDDKARHIKTADAIFIDDSFAERKNVHERCGIPVFDAHMLEGLMEYG